MKSLRLTSWFRARMLPLIVLTVLLLAAAAPLAFYLRERASLRGLAEQTALRAAVATQEEIAMRPALWPYAAAKLTEQLVVAGLSNTPVRLFDNYGSEIRIDNQQAILPRWPLWGHSDIVIDGSKRASVWTALDAQPLLYGTAELSGVFALLALVLGFVLYQIPLAALERAERRMGRLMARLALTMREEDRHRIARDLHDGVGQAITAARLELLIVQTDNAQAGHVGRIAARLDEALDEVRRATEALAPAPLIELGLVPALQRHCESFADATGLKVDCTWATLPDMPADVETACYRIVQEALTNTARHAQARHAWVSLQAIEPTMLDLQVRDDGLGVDADQPGWHAGQGIQGIRDRVDLLGGTVRIASAQGAGMHIAVALPIPPND